MTIYDLDYSIIGRCAEMFLKSNSCYVQQLFSRLAACHESQQQKVGVC
jgi:hypothetical protein